MTPRRVEAFSDGVLAIYWNNHHHIFHVTQRVTGGILWAHLHLLFWLSLIPFITAWMGETQFAAIPTAAYGLVLLLAAIAFWLLQRAILRSEGDEGTREIERQPEWSVACRVLAQNNPFELESPRCSS